MALPDGVQKREYANEIRLAGPVRSDDHVDGLQRQLLDGREAFEPFNGDVIEFGRRHIGFSLPCKSQVVEFALRRRSLHI